MTDDLLPKLTKWTRHPDLYELQHFEVEAWGERILVHKTADGKWKAGSWETIEEIAARLAKKDAPAGGELE